MLAFLFTPMLTHADDGPTDMLVAELLVDTEDIFRGEPVFFTFRTQNRGSEPLWRTLGGQQRNALGRRDSYTCELAAPGSELLPVPDSGMGFGGIEHTVKIAPGDHADERLFLPNWGRPVAPGLHTLTCSTRLRLRDGAGVQTSAERLVTARITLVVREPDDTSMAALIATLSTQLETPRYDEAVRRLTVLDDPRVVPVLARLARSNQPTLALRALARFDDDAALAAIVSALSRTGSDIHNATTTEVADQVAANYRLTAAQALSQSPHPRARRALLDLADHPDANLRLTVVQFLGREGTRKAMRQLEAFVTDPSDRVAGEARRYLSER